MPLGSLIAAREPQPASLIGWAISAPLDAALTGWVAAPLLLLLSGFGLLVVSYNVVSSLFNSHLFDFSQGWLYVFGVGITGGMVLRAADAVAKAEEKP